MAEHRFSLPPVQGKPRERESSGISRLQLNDNCTSLWCWVVIYPLPPISIVLWYIPSNQFVPICTTVRKNCWLDWAWYFLWQTVSTQLPGEILPQDWKYRRCWSIHLHFILVRTERKFHFIPPSIGPYSYASKNKIVNMELGRNRWTQWRCTEKKLEWFGFNPPLPKRKTAGRWEKKGNLPHILFFLS